MSGSGIGQDLESGGKPAQPQVAHKRFQEQQAQVAAVTEIMRTNVDKILQRDEKLADLDDRAEALQEDASEFNKQTGNFKRKYWWRNCKMLGILIGILIFIILVILAWAISVETE